ncbi:MAG: Brp/Blh family beta-carotene 15,15'-dioxygenase [Bacteroidota bacterium]
MKKEVPSNEGTLLQTSFDYLLTMDKLSFLFLSCLYLLITLVASTGPIDPTTQIVVSASLIALLGIPHGAIDHIIFLEESKVQPLHFYLFYFSLIGLYAMGWIVFPTISLIFFLLLSAFHFGQSQFSEFASIPQKTKFLLNFTWGCSILSGLVIYNMEEIIHHSKSSLDLNQLLAAFDENIYTIILLATSLLTIFLLLFSLSKKYLTVEQFFRELFTLAIIHISFFIMPVLVGFTLYFVILHSVRVLNEEFVYLKNRQKCRSILDFVRLLFPYTSISIIGCIIILYGININIINISYTLLLLIFISSLTLPHSIVMNDFYKKFGQGSKL